MSFRKAFATMESTDNRRIYKLARRILYTDCSYCLPNRGDNADHHPQRNWKKFRKLQRKDKDYENS